MALINNDRYSLYYQRLSLIYQKPQIKASLEVILSVFTVTFLIFAAIRPTLSNIASLQRRIDDLDSANKKADNKITQIFGAQSRLSNLADQLYLLDEAVPDSFSYKDMAGRIEVMAKARGLEVLSISLPGKRLFGQGSGAGEWTTTLVKRGGSGISEVAIQFSVTGNPNNIKVFLEDIEKMDRITMLTSINLATETGPARLPILRATGEIVYYFYENDET